MKKMEMLLLYIIIFIFIISDFYEEFIVFESDSYFQNHYYVNKHLTMDSFVDCTRSTGDLEFPFPHI